MRIRMLFLAVLAVACQPGAGVDDPLNDAAITSQDSTAPDVPDAVEAVAGDTLEAVASPLKTMVVAAEVRATVGPALTGVSVEYGDDVTYGRSTPVFAIGAGCADVAVPVLGLTPGHTSHLRVIGYEGDTVTATTGDMTVTTDPLPADYPEFHVTSGSPAGKTFMLLGTLVISAGFKCDGPVVAVLADDTGRLYWYREMFPSVTSQGLAVEPHPDGNIMVYRDSQAGFEEVDLFGNVVRSWNSPSAYGTNGHDVKFLPDGTVVLLGMNAPDNSGVDQFTVTALDANGDEVFEYGNLSGGTAPSHMNSVAVGPDGNLIVSLPGYNTIVKVDFATGEVMWRLGGDHSDFTFVDDPLAGFTWPHDPTPVGDDDILLFDNGPGHDPPVSRVVQYRLDRAAGTATLVWQYHKDPDVYALGGGSAYRLPDGDTRVLWPYLGDLNGRAVVQNVDPSSRVTWELGSNKMAYRAVPLKSLYPPSLDVCAAAK
jgi:hypothetical protein